MYYKSSLKEPLLCDSSALKLLGKYKKPDNMCKYVKFMALVILIYVQNKLRVNAIQIIYF
jgi:hypothetical protein